MYQLTGRRVYGVLYHFLLVQEPCQEFIFYQLMFPFSSPLISSETQEVGVGFPFLLFYFLFFSLRITFEWHDVKDCPSRRFAGGLILTLDG
ncbi:hypothetical protein CEXT_779831 [Caerostris extrusa]|uniref:Uncharacterized protein n=1 Tax=Caerostris extrusa TaxID=172846 RepID=A0AAV4NFI9_CAEEX|nr:hypothetical protein CEXT_779831 [Caerostris extrusa]